MTLAWRAQLEPGTAYYWNDIPIPPELVRNGKLFGKARLTAVLNPLVSPSAGANYFASRLQISLQYIDKPGADWKSLLGPMKESTILVNDARDELKKWSPIRRHCADFTKQGGRQLAKYHFRLYARVYTRDLYQFGWNHHSQAGSQEAAFVLTLLSGEHQRSIYDSTFKSSETLSKAQSSNKKSNRKSVAGEPAVLTRFVALAVMLAVTPAEDTLGMRLTELSNTR